MTVTSLHWETLSGHTGGDSKPHGELGSKFPEEILLICDSGDHSNMKEQAAPVWVTQAAT